MAYKIGHASKGSTKVSVAEAADACSALQTVLALEKSDEKIHYIKDAFGHELAGVGELEYLAECERRKNA